MTEPVADYQMFDGGGGRARSVNRLHCITPGIIYIILEICPAEESRQPDV